MNSVSWFIYASDVVSNLQPTIGIVAGLAGVIAIPTLIVSHIDELPVGLAWGKRLIIGSMIGVLIASLIPSKTTMYAIAASQIGETVVSSPEAREMIDDTKTILRDYLKSMKKDAGK